MAAYPNSPPLPQTIKLPAATGACRVSIAAALELRRTCRTISAKPLSRQALADLLWAACGVNRAEGPFGRPGRTAASASNSQEIDVYVALRDGVYRYDAPAHELVQVAGGDLRGYAMTPGQRSINPDMPVHLIYVADVHRLTHSTGFREPGLQDPETQKSYYCVDVGMIAANVYLYCAAEGLAAWFHNCDRDALALRLGLRQEQRVLFAQSVGQPEEI